MEDFHGDSVVENLLANTGGMDLIPGWERSHMLCASATEPVLHNLCFVTEDDAAVEACVLPLRGGPALCN